MRSRLVVARLRWLAGPRPGVLLAAGLLVAFLVVGFGYEFVSSSAASRRHAERSLAAQAAVSSELTSSLVTSSAASMEAQAAKLFGGHRPDESALTALVERQRGLAYAFVAGGSGQVLARSKGAPDGVGGQASEHQAMAGALGGRIWLSNLLYPASHRAAVVELVVPFRTAFGPRVLVEGLEAKLLGVFLDGYFGRLGRGSGQVSYVVDAGDRVVANSAGKAVGQRLPAAVAAGGSVTVGGVHRFVASAPLAGSSWRVLLSEPTAKLYAGFAGRAQWVLKAVLAVLALVGLSSLLFLRRMLVGRAHVE